jgi:hypothetical protein
LIMNLYTDCWLLVLAGSKNGLESAQKAHHVIVIDFVL